MERQDVAQAEVVAGRWLTVATWPGSLDGGKAARDDRGVAAAVTVRVSQALVAGWRNRDARGGVIGRGMSDQAASTPTHLAGQVRPGIAVARRTRRRRHAIASPSH